MSTGRVIGDRYRLSRPLGGGGMGDVWEAWDVRLDRRVAVKLLRPAAFVPGGDANALAVRFEREARMTARLNHRGVPVVHDTGADQNDMYLVMELVEGMDLAEFQAANRPMPGEWIAAIGAQIAAVLSAAHTAQLVHRDLKPGNVMITPAGEVKVLDFGIAVLRDPGVPRLTLTSEALGTPAYMSPEQAMGQTSPSSDLYSLGCVLYELAAGRRVFDAPTPLALMQRHYAERPVPLRDIRPDLPVELTALVDRMLAKQPAHRPAHAREVYDRLILLVGRTPVRPEALMDPTRPFRDPLADADSGRPAATTGDPAPAKPQPDPKPKQTKAVSQAPAAEVSRPVSTPAAPIVEGLLICGGLLLLGQHLASAVAGFPRNDIGMSFVFAFAMLYLGAVLRQRRLGLRKLWTVRTGIRWDKPPQPMTGIHRAIEVFLFIVAGAGFLAGLATLSPHNDSAARAFVFAVVTFVPAAVMRQRRLGKTYPWSR
ncbi:serine/threonine protein kinase [Kibdelosporangium banguiense]|uniref:non-specific serine/threonine protein kinase n=1 Tax=Kibdelosporangium banguiense TaxID=1365924 RepID=A0ABS4TA28_9PSEU|nr:serine/threonine-protein kinase [Kibdelosporangium banguiense]MBP2320696.1 serine/threonine protein kinase [Kibdelosporangium banguiense]